MPYCNALRQSIPVSSMIGHDDFYMTSSLSDGNGSESATSADPLSRIDIKAKNAVRFVTFNVNGIKTLFNYYPWTVCLSNLDTVLEHLDGDIVTLQELKLSQVEKPLCSNYWGFVTLPKYKKGYSGVGLFIRKSLAVPIIKAEEGISGHLRLAGTKYRERPSECRIGAYPTRLAESRYIELDNEGRCIMVELANDTVIIAVYCPANSMGTEEGEQFRMDYLTCLLERCLSLTKIGKQVVLMGDINVSLDLIDHAESLSMASKQNAFINTELSFELDNLQACIKFKSSTKARELLNDYVIPAPQFQDNSSKPSQCLYDTTRIHIGRKRNVYTVWNTLTGARQLNYGSRIDLILSSLTKWPIANAGIWPFLMGSDHCPVFTDFEWPELNHSYETRRGLWIEVEMNKYYNLSRHQDITSLFGRKRTAPDDQSLTNGCSNLSIETQSKKSKLVYVSRKKQSGVQRSIGNFFTKSESCSKSSLVTEPSSDESFINIQSSPLFVGTVDDEPTLNCATTTIESISRISDVLLGKPPRCNHGLECQLRTSLSNPKTRGKKFWCCPKKLRNLLNTPVLGDYQCSFFQWVSK